VKSKLVFLPPPIYAALILGLCYGIGRVIPLPLDLAAPLMGGLVVAAALTLLLWSWVSFRRLRTTPIPTGTPRALVVTGPYRWTRNPMYLGIVSLLAAVPLFDGSAWYVLAPPMFWYVVNTLFIPYEEAKLLTLFGSEYEAFRAKVPRWF